jgi:FlgD Ig-like domain
MIKKFSYICFLVLLIFQLVAAQVPNGDFENWTNGNPDSWLVNNSPNLYVPITQSADKYSGNYALKGEVVSYANQPSPPALTIQFNISKIYNSFIGYYKFFPVDRKDNILMVVGVYKDGSIEGSGKGEIIINQASADYNKFALPIKYSNPNPQVPDHCSITILLLDTAETNSSPNIGAYYLFDDFELSEEVTSGIKNYANNLPGELFLYNNYPNPFNPATKIKYSISKPNNVIINIYDMNGKLVAALLNEEQNAGTYEVAWNGKNSKGEPVASGVYCYRVQAGSFSKLSKMILMK